MKHLNHSNVILPVLTGVICWSSCVISARGEPLRDLTSISSVNGKLQADLVIKNIETSINGHRVHGFRTYNGQYPGPTFRGHPGDTMNIRYINRLENSGDHATTSAHGHNYNSVNLHTHGLNVSPSGYSDNVYLDILPGYWVPFEFHIPTNHPTGLFWYHPHRHGGTSTQVGCALTGNLILTGKGDLDEIPEIAAAKKVEMIFNEIPLVAEPSEPGAGHYRVPDDGGDAGNAGTDRLPDSLKIYALNGAPVLELEKDGSTNAVIVRPLSPPEITIRPFEVQRLQLTHAGLDQFLNVVMEDEKGVRQPLNLISYDGITIPKVDPTLGGLLLGDGNRAEFLIQAGVAGKVYHLKSIPNAEQLPDGNFDIPLLTITVAGAPVLPTILPINLNPPISRLPNIADSEIVRKRTMTFDTDLSAFATGRAFTVDGQPFDGLSTAQTMLLDTAEEWVIKTVGLTNVFPSPPLSHPFHIHVNWFQVVKINDVPVPPRWQDTIVIPFNGSVTIRHRFQQYTGRYVLHCHILPHEDLGMMAGVEVVDPKNLDALQSWRKTTFGTFENYGPSSDAAVTLGGLPNLFHYAYGVSTSSAAGLPIQQVIKDTGKDYLGFKFDWRAPLAGATNPASYVLFASTNLVEWTPATSLNVGVPVNKTNGFQSLVVRDTQPISGGQKRFLQMTIQTEPVALPITPDLPQ
jgi:FtsP/CotA-like multicopper oxidase with cupredoxin domain